jgi:succinate dehydrogenase / fumarate reductase cytochrome b subunit
MSDPSSTLRSTISLKAMMAVTGLLLFGFVVGHLAGNLQIFAGRDALNRYAAFLKSSPLLLWGARLGLLAALAIHLHAAAVLSRRSLEARPVPYAKYVTSRTGYAARAMLWTGLCVLFYVGYHLAHFTFGWVQPEAFASIDAEGRHDVYGMVVAGFRQWPIAAIYLIAQLVLGMHLSHGVSSAVQSLGVRHPRLLFLKSWFGPSVGTAIFLGYASIPAAVVLGFVR